MGKTNKKLDVAAQLQKKPPKGILKKSPSFGLPKGAKAGATQAQQQQDPTGPKSKRPPMPPVQPAFTEKILERGVVERKKGLAGEAKPKRISKFKQRRLA